MPRQFTIGTTRLLGVIVGSALVACGATGDETTQDPTALGQPSPSPAAAPTVAASQPTNDVGTVTLHRLNASEYDNTVRDLVTDMGRLSSAFPPDDGANSFTNNADSLTISPVLFEQYEIAADKVSAAAVARADIMDCDVAVRGKDECATTILARFTTRAWRRRVTTEEVARLAALVTTATDAGVSFNEGILLAIKATLLSPNFLFRVELDPDPASTSPHPLSDYELASRLSYFLWSSMPDDTLFAYAEAGKLSADDALFDTEVRRMLRDPKAQALLDGFVSEWLTHTLAAAHPDPAQFPSFDEGLRAAMAGETKAFVGSFIFGDQALPDMLDADFTFVNSRMAQHYGIAGVFGTSFVRVPAPPASHRGGLFGQASILTMTSVPTRTSPVLRGFWTLSALLCAPPPPPPPNIPSLPTDISVGTMRQQMEEHRKNPTCATCHQLMDPIGFALENYDAVGHWRDTDHGAAIDATGQLPQGQPFDGPSALAKEIKKDPRLADCATAKIFSYALGRVASTTDASRIAALSKTFTAGNYRMRDLIVTITQDSAFRTRHGGK